MDYVWMTRPVQIWQPVQIWHDTASDARRGRTGVFVTLTEKNQCRRFGCFLRSQMNVLEMQYAVLAKLK